MQLKLSTTRQSYQRAIDLLEKRKDHRFIVGPYTGAGLSNTGIVAQIGIGITYKLFSF